MKKTIIAAAFLCVALAPAAHANETIAADWLIYYPNACETLTDALLEANDCVLCHNPGADTLNAYGFDLSVVGGNFLTAEGFDSDGDGRTSGQEILLDCTLPGDFGSVPVHDSTWSAVKALFR